MNITKAERRRRRDNARKRENRHFRERLVSREWPARSYPRSIWPALEAALRVWGVPAGWRKTWYA